MTVKLHDVSSTFIACMDTCFSSHSKQPDIFALLCFSNNSTFHLKLLSEFWHKLLLLNQHLLLQEAHYMYE